MTTLTSRGIDPMVVTVSFVGLLGGYYFAPTFPAWAIVGTLLAITFAGSRIARHHAGQEYSPATWALLAVGISLQLVGPLVAVAARALK